MGLNKNTVIERFWQAKDQKDGFERRSGFLPNGVRDIVKKENGEVKYLLWGNPIAVLKDGILKISDCGWKTSTTKERLSNILREGGIDLTISQERGVWYLYDWRARDKKYIWGDGVEIPLKRPLSRLKAIDDKKISADAKKLNEPVRRFMKEMKSRIDNNTLAIEGECWGITFMGKECRNCEHFCTTNCGGGVSLLAKAITSRRSSFAAAIYLTKGDGKPDIEKIRENWDGIAMDLRNWLKKNMMLKKAEQIKGVGA